LNIFRFQQRPLQQFAMFNVARADPSRRIDHTVPGNVRWIGQQAQRPPDGARSLWHAKGMGNP